MKKGTIIAIVVAILMILAGGILLVMGLNYAGSSTPESMLTEQIVTIAEPFDSIKINTQDCDVKFVPYNGDADAEIHIFEQDGVSHQVLVEDGVLTIKMIDERNWTDYISVFNVYGQPESMSMTLCVPNQLYTSMHITTDTGDVRIPQMPDVVEMVLRSSTGEIICEGVCGDTLDCMTSTGDITVQTSTPTFMKLHSSTGDLKVSVAGGQEIHLKTDTGEVNARNVNALMFTCSSNTGDVELENVQAQDYLQAMTSTGDIDIENCDAKDVNIQSSTGDITVPADWQFQLIGTDTGSIKFE